MVTTTHLPSNIENLKAEMFADAAEVERAMKEKRNQSALDTQVGGNHYKDMAIQPIEFTSKNNLSFCQGSVIKYITRYKNKNGIEDLKKVKHYAELIAKLEYGADI